MRNALWIAALAALGALLVVILIRDQERGQAVQPDHTPRPAPSEPADWEPTEHPEPALEPEDEPPQEKAVTQGPILPEAARDSTAGDAWHPPGPPPQPPRLTQQRQAELKGRVIDSHTGRPIEGAQVFLNSPVHLALEVHSTFTDGGGCFSLGTRTWMETGTVSIVAPGYQYGLWFHGIFMDDFEFPPHVPRDFLPRHECGLVFTLEPGAARVFGIARDASGRPVSEGYVLAYRPKWIDGLALDKDADRFSELQFFGDAPDSNAPHAPWGLYSTSFSALDEEGAFDILTLPPDLRMGLLVLAPDVKRQIVGWVSLGPGEEQEQGLEVERWAAISGQLTPPDGEAPTAFGLWACTHGDPPCFTEPWSGLGRDLWIPVRSDGSFKIGPLDPGRAARLRVSYRSVTKSPDRRLTYFSGDTLLLQPGDAARNFLEVDLRRPKHFTLIQSPD